MFAQGARCDHALALCNMQLSTEREPWFPQTVCAMRAQVWQMEQMTNSCPHCLGNCDLATPWSAVLIDEHGNRDVFTTRGCLDRYLYFRRAAAVGKGRAAYRRKTSGPETVLEGPSWFHLPRGQVDLRFYRAPNRFAGRFYRNLRLNTQIVEHLGRTTKDSRSR